MADALLHSSAVYFYAYDPQTRAYAQQTESVVGCALLSSSGDGDNSSSDDNAPFKLLFYNSQKQPLLQLAVTASSPTCTPQQDNYVNFLDDATQKFYSMRFKDAAGVTAFLSAVAFVKAQLAATTSSSSKKVVLIDELALGKEDGKGYGLTPGDVAGVALTVWQGTSAGFFTENPLDIAKQQAAEVIERDGDVRRVRLVEKSSDGDDNDPLGKALATEALVGMQKNAKRLVTVVVPQTQQWFIASVELVKVKKGTRSSAAASTSAPAQPAAAAQDVNQQYQQQQIDEANGSVNDELIQRMASLSRAGSKGSGLIASLSSRSAQNGQSPDINGSRKTSFAELQAAVAQKFVPLPGMQSSDEKRSASMSAGQDNGSAQRDRTSHHESLAAKVIAPLKDTSRASSFDLSASSTTSVSSEMERLIQEQSDLAQLRKQLEESKRKLQEGDDDAKSSVPSTVGARSSFGGVDQSRTASGFSAPLGSLSSLTTSSFTPSTSSFGGSTSNLYGQPSANQWTPSSSSLDIVPSYQPPMSFLSASNSVVPPPYQPPPASSFNPSLSASSSYTSRSLVTTPAFSSQSPPGGTSRDVESGILRLQRSSTSIESALQDIQSKVDRLLNSQSSLKSSKYTPGASSSSLSFSSSGLSSSSGPLPSSTSSSSILLKNLEKALTQRDQLQELNGRLQEAQNQMESTIEDLQSQHESLQMENRNLLDKLQNGNHLQQEKFRLELRNVQQQLGHTQEQMLVYQEENFRLRNELAAKDDQLLNEKAQLQDDARKQLESLQRQLEAQVRQDSKDSIDKVLKEKSYFEAQVKELAAQKQQWEQERDVMTSQLRLAQSQIQDERSRSQSVQDTRVQELQVQLQQMGSETRGLSQQVEALRADNRELEELLAAKEHEVETLQETKSSQEYAALSELLKEFMNDIYFHFQDAFDEDTEFTGKEIVMAIRKILKQNTMDILTKLEEFWQLQAQNKSR
ncbi:hypothetical protein Gpo141_00010850 [Globisporangium polare]